MNRVLLFVVAALVAGCQSAAAPPVGDAVALRVDLLAGGPRGPGTVDFPTFVLYGDGRLIVADGEDGGTPVAREYHVTGEEFTRLYEKAREAGLAEPREFRSQTPDASVLVVTFGHASGRAVTRIVAPDVTTAGEVGRVVRAVTA